jgi:hypothetical protein
MSWGTTDHLENLEEEGKEKEKMSSKWSWRCSEGSNLKDLRFDVYIKDVQN